MEVFEVTRGYSLGYRDAAAADRVVQSALLATSLECPLGQNTPRCDCDDYWRGVKAAVEDVRQLAAWSE